jgi:transcriptional regulator with XRE-family HTH domain
VLSLDQKIKYQKFYAELGRKVKKARQRAGYSQEDMMSYGWTLNQWQRIESDKPITLTTLLRVVEVLGVPMRLLVSGCDKHLIEGNSQRNRPTGGKPIPVSRISSPKI